MRDFSKAFCINCVFFVEKIALFYDFFSWNQIKTRVFSKKSLNGGFFIEQYRSSIGIWIDVLIWLGSGTALLGDWRWAIGRASTYRAQRAYFCYLKVLSFSNCVPR